MAVSPTHTPPVIFAASDIDAQLDALSVDAGAMMDAVGPETGAAMAVAPTKRAKKGKEPEVVAPSFEVEVHKRQRLVAGDIGPTVFWESVAVPVPVASTGTKTDAGLVVLHCIVMADVKRDASVNGGTWCFLSTTDATLASLTLRALMGIQLLYEPILRCSWLRLEMSMDEYASRKFFRVWNAVVPPSYVPFDKMAFDAGAHTPCQMFRWAIDADMRSGRVCLLERTRPRRNDIGISYPRLNDTELIRRVGAAGIEELMHVIPTASPAQWARLARCIADHSGEETPESAVFPDTILVWRPKASVGRTQFDAL
jgi:hypothetical protein